VRQFGRDARREFGQAQVPGGRELHRRRHLAADTLQQDRRRQTLDEIGQHGDADLLVEQGHAGRVALPGARHGRAAHELQLVQLERVDRQRRHPARAVEHAVHGLARQPQQQVRRHIKSARCGALDRVGAGGKVVAAVDAGQHRVVAGLDADLELDDVLARALRQIVQHRIGQAVGPRADRQAADLRVRERFLVAGTQVPDLAVGVAVALEVADVALRAGIAAFQEVEPGVDLLGDGLAPAQITGRETVVVAEGAATGGDLAVAVRAGEAGLDRDLLHAAAVARLHMLVPGAVAARPERAFGVLHHAFSYQCLEWLTT